MICRWDDVSMIIINLNAVHKCRMFPFYGLSALPQIQIGNTLIRALSVCFNILFIFVWSNLTHLWSLINNIVYDSINTAGSWYSALNRIEIVEKDPYIHDASMYKATPFISMARVFFFSCDGVFRKVDFVLCNLFFLILMSDFRPPGSLIGPLNALFASHVASKSIHSCKYKRIEHGTPKIEHWKHQIHMYYPNDAIDWGKIRF